MNSHVAMRFIDAGQDLWQAPPAAATTPFAHALLSLEQWSAVRTEWPVSMPVGVVVTNAVDVETLADDLRRWSLVALQFPKWTDGRAYSQARLLRARLRYAGEVRATGEVLVDMLPLLQRSGFDAVLMRPTKALTRHDARCATLRATTRATSCSRRPLFARIEA